jgi:prepilin-type processing-associated H-X9-DG protein
MPLSVDLGTPGWSWNYDPDTFVIQNSALLWWQDQLRLAGLIRSPNVFNCSVLTQPASDGHGQAVSAVYSLGIGMNFPEFGWLATNGIAKSYTVYNKSYENEVSAPSQSIVFADAASTISTGTKDLEPDLWREDVGTGGSYFRAPSDMGSYKVGDGRSIPRHDGQLDVVFFDGHGVKLRNREIHYELPRTDSAILWAKNNTGTPP